jgi:hypothetical protein
VPPGGALFGRQMNVGRLGQSICSSFHWYSPAGGYPSAFILVMPVSYWLGLTFGQDFIGIMTGIMIAGAINERIVFRIARPHLKKIIARDDKG